MRFSVIVPIYNGKKYLEQCIGCVLAQTYPDYELILVDDGSTDGSGHLCDIYGRRFPDIIKVVHQKNSGTMSARISGLKHCLGEYVYFCDSDDYMDASLLETVNTVIEATKAEMILFSYRTVDIHGSAAEGVPHLCPQGKLSRDVLFAAWLKNTNLNNVWLKIVKKELAPWRGLDHPSYRIPNGEDLIMSLLIAQKATAIYYQDAPLYFHRINPDGAVFQCRKGCHHDIVTAYPLFLDTLKTLSLDTPDNRKDFFVLYLLAAYQRAKIISASKWQRQDKKSALYEISSFGLFRKIMGKAPRSTIPRRKRLLLKLLYQGRYPAVICYGTVLSTLDRGKSRIKKTLHGDRI